MANTCDSTYRIAGDASDLDELQKLMETLGKKPVTAPNWVGYIVEALNDGKIPEHLYVRGWWYNLEREDGCLVFHQESAWEPIYDAWDFICSKFKTLRACFIGEEPGCEVFLKRNDEEHNWFPDNYMVDAYPPGGNYHTKYFLTLDEAFRYIEKLDDVNIITADDVEVLNLKWGEEDEDAYVYLHEFQEV